MAQKPKKSQPSARSKSWDRFGFPADLRIGPQIRARGREAALPAARRLTRYALDVLYPVSRGRIAETALEAICGRLEAGPTVAAIISAVEPPEALGEGLEVFVHAAVEQEARRGLGPADLISPRFPSAVELGRIESRISGLVGAVPEGEARETLRARLRRDVYEAVPFALLSQHAHALLRSGKRGGAGRRPGPETLIALWVESAAAVGLDGDARDKLAAKLCREVLGTDTSAQDIHDRLKRRRGAQN